MGFRERVNYRIYASKETVLKVLNVITFVVALGALIMLAYFYGFPQTESSYTNMIGITRWMLAYFVLQFLIRVFYSFEVPKLLRDNWLEALFMSLIIVEGASFFLFDFPIAQSFLSNLGIKNIGAYYLLIVQLYMLIVAGLGFMQASHELMHLKIKPDVSLILSLMVLLLVGAVLLTMPEMTTMPGSITFLNALFTSVSAICQTGLIVVDTATYFTTKGHIIIMLLIQIGAIGIVSFGTMLARQCSLS